MQTAMDAAHSPTIEPTEMSISPVMMISVMAERHDRHRHRAGERNRDVRRGQEVFGDLAP